jgi:hypothetical protein
VLIVLLSLIKYKRRKRATKLSSPVNIPLTDETPKDSLPIDQVNYLRLVSLELIEPSNIYKLSLVQVSSCSNTGSIGDDPYWISRKNSLELIELSSINKVSLVQVSSCSNTRSIRDDSYWTSRENSYRTDRVIQFK